jgi:hypothetical protein
MIMNGRERPAPSLEEVFSSSFWTVVELAIGGAFGAAVGTALLMQSQRASSGEADSHGDAEDSKRRQAE